MRMCWPRCRVPTARPRVVMFSSRSPGRKPNSVIVSSSSNSTRPEERRVGKVCAPVRPPPVAHLLFQAGTQGFQLVARRALDRDLQEDVADADVLATLQSADGQAARRDVLVQVARTEAELRNRLLVQQQH